MREPAIIARIVGLLFTVAWPLVSLAQNHLSNTNSVKPGEAVLNTTPLPQQYPPTAPLSRPTSEVVRLIQSGVDENVLLSFIARAGRFDLSVDQVIYLNDLGAPSKIAKAMLAHDWEITPHSQRTNLTSGMVSSPAPSTERDGVQQANQMQVSMGQVLAGTESQSVKLGETTTTSKPQFPLTNSVGPIQPPIKKRILYPIREPYPVELTTPIVFLEPPSF